MLNKKIGIVFFVIFIVILSLSFAFNSSPQLDTARLSLLGRLDSKKIQINFTSAIINLVDGNREILVEKTENTCYWITTVRWNGGYFLEIKKYNSTEHDCNGEILEEGLVPTGKPIGIIGETNCLCDKNIVIKRIDEDTGIFFKIS